MCGICGIVGPQVSLPESQDIVGQMMDILAHRGPDGQGMVAEENFIFGHRRLAIIDIQYGAQPMQSDDGRISLVHNGEIYNYLELRQELTRKGATFKTFSDTEVLLRMYEFYGIDCIPKLNGMFAFALYDSHQNLFVAARDHFGIKPFYYVQLPDSSIIFASEIKAILQHPDVSAELAQDALNEYLTFQFCLGEKTLFKNIKKLKPAHHLQKKAENSQIDIGRYWSLSYEIDMHHTDKYFVDKMLLLLQDSVRSQLRSDVPLGGYLSGGLDSSSVITLSSIQYGNEFKCFTGKFAEGPAYDESRYARLVAQENNCRYYEVVPTAQDFIQLMPRLIYHMDEPAAGPGMFPQYLVSKLAKEHVKVVLGGQGGDEILGGYARYLVAYLEQCIKGSIFETQEEGQHIVTLASIVPNLPLLRQYAPLLRSFWKDGLFDPMDARYFRLVDRSQGLANLLHPDILMNYNRAAIFEEFQTIFNHPQTKAYFNKMTHFDHQTLLPALLHVEDRVSMAVSLESRVPLLDPRIGELVAGMPPNMKFNGGQTKFILKNAMRSLLPKPILERKDKMGFPVPLKEWLNGPLKDFVSDIFLSKTCRQRGIFNSKGLRELIEVEGQYGRQIWGALCLELWHRIFIDGESVS
jgi:asparagine synthase (glutamine-hydrolysing)